jgi:hypothetical protein
LILFYFIFTEQNEQLAQQTRVWEAANIKSAKGIVEVSKKIQMNSDWNQADKRALTVVENSIKKKVPFSQYQHLVQQLSAINVKSTSGTIRNITELSKYVEKNKAKQINVEAEIKAKKKNIKDHEIIDNISRQK